MLSAKLFFASLSLALAARVSGSAIPPSPRARSADAAAAARPRQNDPVQVLTECTVPGTAAITFDDGPFTYTTEVSRILLENDAVGTFFFNGYNWDCINNPDEAARIQAIFDAGHQVGSHTWGHKDLTTLSWGDLVNEMASVPAAIQGIIGKIPAQMRPPFGAYNDAVLEAASSLGQDIVLWNLDTGDSDVSGTVEGGKTEYIKGVEESRPILALNHETHETTVYDILPSAIRTLKDAGYRLVSVAECTGREPYLSDDTQLPPTSLTC